MTASTVPAERTLGEMIQESSRMLSAVFEMETSPIPVPMPMLEVLFQLLVRPGQSQVSLARYVSMDASTMGRAVDRMISQELVERRRSDQDRRAWALFLTPEGEAVAERVQRIFQRIEGEVAGEMGKSDFEMIKWLLSRFLAASNELYQDGNSS